MTEFNPAAAGWTAIEHDPMPAGLGTVWQKHDGERLLFGLLTRADHANPAGAVHGGILVTFADHMLGRHVEITTDAVPNVTIQLNTHFLAAVTPGTFLELRAEVTRATGSLVFIRGIISVDGHDSVALDGIWRVFRPRKR